jgi:hypothetical protein
MLGKGPGFESLDQLMQAGQGYARCGLRIYPGGIASTLLSPG